MSEQPYTDCECQEVTDHSVFQCDCECHEDDTPDHNGPGWGVP
jgi:hypothetical protein